MIHDDFSCTADLEKPEPLAQFGSRCAECALKAEQIREKRSKKTGHKS